MCTGGVNNVLQPMKVTKAPTQLLDSATPRMLRPPILGPKNFSNYETNPLQPQPYRL